MKKNSNFEINIIYLMIIFIILGGVLGIVDFRLSLNDKFSLINDLLSIIFIIYILKNIAKRGIVVYSDIRNIQKIGSLFIGVLLINCIISIAINNELNSSILAVKNLIIPICLLILGILDCEKIKYINTERIVAIVNFFAIINIILVLFGFYLGWQRMTEYVLGEQLYAFSVYSFGNSASLLRVPGLFVDALTQGSFSFLVFIINLCYLFDKKQKKKYSLLVFMIIGFLGIILSTNRQIILGTIIAFIVLFIIKNRKASLIIAMFSTLIGTIGSFFIINSNKDIFSIESLVIRLNVWKSIIDDMGLGNNFFGLFIGTGVDATTLGKGNYGIQLVDNGYLLILHDYGLIGLMLFILLLISLLIFFQRNLEKNFFAKVSFLYLIYFIIRLFFHSSVVNEYDSNMFYLVSLIGIVTILYEKRYTDFIK
ncbi:hypothetical protein QTI42_14825 [Clostridium perfringens]|uniref:hypothetical protein n=2 Tax=Clostridium perfringens TaxID=1502 RepID=UPI000F52BD1E|nr:hypothetical protein [Clostridium perfringens]MDM0851340.1 hypothetical protein [Clostridium perfringens]RQN11020.1 hypothetical protein EHZ13_15400 [Clostridium perfringens]